jgi:hypothetical protein
MSTSDEFGWKWMVTCKIMSEHLKGESEKSQGVHLTSFHGCRDSIRVFSYVQNYRRYCL